MSGNFSSAPVPNDTFLCYEEQVFTEDHVFFRLYLNMPISVFGMLANILNIIVFRDREMRHSLVNWFLMAISITDLCLLICNFFFLLFPVIAELSGFPIFRMYYTALVRHSYPLGLISQTAGVYLTVLVSVHRFLGVCHPFKAQRWVTKKPVKFAIIGAIMFSILLNLSRWFELRLITCYSVSMQDYMLTIELTELQQSKHYGIIYKAIIYTLVMFVIPFCTLILVNTLIIVELKKSHQMRLEHTGMHAVTPNGLHVNNNVRNGNKTGGDVSPLLPKKLTYEMPQLRMFRQIPTLYRSFSKISLVSTFRSRLASATPGSARDRSVTMMLLAIVAFFLICNSLAFCNNIVEIAMSYSNTTLIHLSDFEKSVEMSNILVSLNSSTTIFIYVSFSSKYRLIVKRLVGLAERPNIIALTTALAARRALELSALPNELRLPKRTTKVRLVSPNRSDRVSNSASKSSMSPKGARGPNSPCEERLLSKEHNNYHSWENNNGRQQQPQPRTYRTPPTILKRTVSTSSDKNKDALEVPIPDRKYSKLKPCASSDSMSRVCMQAVEKFTNPSVAEEEPHSPTSWTSALLLQENSIAEESATEV